MRIIAGEWRSRRLGTPRGLKVRPTSDRAREALFNVLGQRVPGAAFLDLFAGTGAVGLEALSRGARQAVFVEGNLSALASLSKNIESLGADARCRVIRGDWSDACQRLGREASAFDLVFADPPYGGGLAESCLRSPLVDAILLAGGLLVIEHHRKVSLPPPPEGLVLGRRLPAGEAVFDLYRKEK